MGRGKDLKAVTAVQGLDHQTCSFGVVCGVEDIASAKGIDSARATRHTVQDIAARRLGTKEDIAGCPDRSHRYAVGLQGKDGRDRYGNYRICNGHTTALKTAPAVVTTGDGAGMFTKDGNSGHSRRERRNRQSLRATSYHRKGRLSRKGEPLR